MVTRTRAAAIIVGLLIDALAMAACIAGERPAVDHLICNGGQCFCAAGYGNCDGNPTNGCEAVLQVDPDHCGSCDLACTNGRCEGGACECNEGFYDCNLDMDEGGDGCEALLALDPENCGACGRSCLGGNCGQSTCEPFLLAELGTYIYALTADASAVYFCDGGAGALYSVSKDTGEIAPIAFDQNCYEMAAADGQLFWSVREHGEELIRVVPVGGGTLHTIAITNDVLAFAAGEGRAIWSEYDSTTLNTTLYAADMAGAVTTVTTTPNDIPFAKIASGQAFWAETIIDMPGSIKRASFSGGAVSTVATVQRDLGAFTIVGDDLYWLETSDENAEPVIYRVGIAGGTAEPLYSRNRQVDTLIGDETGLYWTEDEGDRLVRAPLDGGTVEILAQYQDISLLVLGAQSIYWRDYPSHLFALAK